VTSSALADATAPPLRGKLATVRLVPKLTIAFLAGSLAVLGVNGVLRVRREVRFFENAAARDHRAIGGTLAVAVAATWRAEGEARARALVDEAQRRQARVQLRIAPLPAFDAAAYDALVREGALTRVEHGAKDDQRVTWIPLAGVTGGRALAVSESLAEERAYVRRTIVDTLLISAALATIDGLLAMVLGTWLVGWPVRRLVEKARRVGASDFGGPLPIAGDDELGALGSEMNAMCERLADAQEALADAAEARVRAVEQLRHADRLGTVGTLASGIAHELGTPLNVVAARAEMIARGEVGGDEALRSAAVIEQSAARMTSILRQLLDFARRRPAQTQPFDLVALARDTTALVSTLAEKKGIALDVHGDEREVVAEVDVGPMQQALANLVVNAIQAVAPGGQVRVEVARDVRDIDGVAAKCVLLRVRDDGGGIDGDDLPHVFEPFFTTKPVGEGTGLGLSVAYGIARDHGGLIEAESERARGSTFTIVIPERTSEPRRVGLGWMEASPA
jgi:signal transduction histidine kinase